MSELKISVRERPTKVNRSLRDIQLGVIFGCEAIVEFDEVDDDDAMEEEEDRELLLTKVPLPPSSGKVRTSEVALFDFQTRRVSKHSGKDLAWNYVEYNAELILTRM